MPAAGRRVALVRDGFDNAGASSFDEDAFSAGGSKQIDVKAFIAFDVCAEGYITAVVDPGIDRVIENPSAGSRVTRKYYLREVVVLIYYKDALPKVRSCAGG